MKSISRIASQVTNLHIGDCSKKVRFSTIACKVQREVQVKLIYVLITVLASTVLFTPTVAQQVSACGNPFNVPHRLWDYTDAADRRNPQGIPLIERNHFNLDVQMGRRGQTAYDVKKDLDFILRHVPNHHRALHVLMKHHLRFRPDVPQYSSPLCYLERAKMFRPQDSAVRMLMGIYYAQTENDQQALEEYREGLRLDPDSVELHYNLGLLLADIGQLEQANMHAVRAYQLGWQLPGLKRKLIRLKAWNPDLAAQPVAVDEPEAEAVAEERQ